MEIIQLSENGTSFIHRQSFDHQYPPTKILWIPDKNSTKPDLLCTSGEYLRIWSVNQSNNSVGLKAELKNVSNSLK